MKEADLVAGFAVVRADPVGRDPDNVLSRFYTNAGRL